MRDKRALRLFRTVTRNSKKPATINAAAITAPPRAPAMSALQSIYLRGPGGGGASALSRCNSAAESDICSAPCAGCASDGASGSTSAFLISVASISMVRPFLGRFSSPDGSLEGESDHSRGGNPQPNQNGCFLFARQFFRFG